MEELDNISNLKRIRNTVEEREKASNSVNPEKEMSIDARTSVCHLGKL